MIFTILWAQVVGTQVVVVASTASIASVFVLLDEKPPQTGRLCFSITSCRETLSVMLKHNLQPTL
jgi:hypothetical protein